ncbi:hypothetical protein K474DRAFT_326954 [Panus rudis PR-1116 ss-1]|nr:hypothetical protein K474DRAFT_326954 [Panus rudis PR-1116 ss-1]
MPRCPFFRVLTVLGLHDAACARQILSKQVRTVTRPGITSETNALPRSLSRNYKVSDIIPFLFLLLGRVSGVFRVAGLPFPSHNLTLILSFILTNPVHFTTLTSLRAYEDVLPSFCRACHAPRRCLRCSHP